MGCKGAGSASGASGTSMLEEAAVCGCAVEEDDGQVLDMATLSMCTRYAQLAIDIENPPLNTSFVLQWMLHARLRERQALLQVTQPTPLTPPPTTSTIESVAVALRGASTLSAIASALGLDSYLGARDRGVPAAPTR